MSKAMKSLIDKHFKGTLKPNETRTMFAGLEGSEDLREYFARRQLLADMNPDALSAKERIGQNLGLTTATKKSAAWATWVPALGVSAAAAAALLILVPAGLSQSGSDDGFTARGGDKKLAALTIEEVRVFEIKGQKSDRVGRRVTPTAELAFAYRNPKSHPYIMIFGVDDGGEVYWYYPAWTDPAENPKAVPAKRGGSLVELSEAVSHNVQGQRLRLYSYFTDSPTSVREVERSLQQSGPGAAMQLIADLGVVH